MGKYLLKGHVSYAVGRKYKWIAEFDKNTCEQCAALDGQEFDEEDVPFWPHPNCRCKVEEISEIDEIESEINEYKEELEQLKLQANELLGDTNVLREQFEKTIKEAQSKEANTLEAKLTRLEYDIYRLLDKIEKLTIETIDKFVIEKIQKEIERIKNSVQSYANEFKNLSLKLKAEKLTVDAGVKVASPLARDAAALWQLASSKFTRGLDYIEKNGKIVEKVSDLKNNKLETFISTKLNSQLGVKNTRGVVFSVDSSISTSIVNSKEFNEFMKTNIEKFIDKSLSNKSIGDTSLSFKLANSLNNFGAIHNCDIIDMKVVNGIFHAKVIDTVEYNPNELIVLFPRDLQEGGAIENYYVIIEISVPIEKWTTKNNNPQ